MIVLFPPGLIVAQEATTATSKWHDYDLHTHYIPTTRNALKNSVPTNCPHLVRAAKDLHQATIGGTPIVLTSMPKFRCSSVKLSLRPGVTQSPWFSSSRRYQESPDPTWCGHFLSDSARCALVLNCSSYDPRGTWRDTVAISLSRSSNPVGSLTTLNRPHLHLHPLPYPFTLVANLADRATRTSIYGCRQHISAASWTSTTGSTPAWTPVSSTAETARPTSHLPTCLRARPTRVRYGETGPRSNAGNWAPREASATKTYLLEGTKRLSRRMNWHILLNEQFHKNFRIVDKRLLV